MADVEINKPKTEKTSASLTSTLPRLCRTTKLPTKEISCNVSCPLNCLDVLLTTTHSGGHFDRPPSAFPVPVQGGTLFVVLDCLFTPPRWRTQKKLYDTQGILYHPLGHSLPHIHTYICK